MIPVQQFPTSRPQDNPLYFGINNLLGAYAQQIQNQQAMQQTKNLQQQLKMLQSQTEGQDIKNKYAPFETMMEAERLKQQDAQLQNSQNRFGLFYQLQKFYNTPVGLQLLKDNPQLASAYSRVASGSTDMADQQVLAKSAGISIPSQTNLSPQFVDQYNQLFPQSQQSYQEQPQPISPFIAKPTIDQLASGDKNQLMGITPEQVKNLQDVAGSEAIKKTVPNQVQLQRYYSESANNMIDSIDPMIEKLSKYSGVYGKSERLKNKVAAQLGMPVPQDYNDYVTFANLTSQTIANELGRGFGNHATDQQKEWMKELSNPMLLADNPQQAIQLWKALKASIEQNERAISKSPNQIQESLQNRLDGKPLQDQLPAVNAPKSSDQSGWFKDVNGKLMYRAKDGNVYTEEELK